MSENEPERWLTYTQLGQLLGCTSSAARMHAVRRGWERRSPNMIGGRATVLVPADVVVHPRATAVQRTFIEQPNGHDQANDQAIRAAIEALREQLTIANARADRAEAALVDAHRKIIEILTGPRRSWWRRWFR